MNSRTVVLRVLVPVSLATALSLLGDTSLYTVLPTHVDAAGITLASVGVVLSANRFIRLVLNGPVGLATDRWPRRLVFVPALFIGALSTSLYALTEGFWPLLAGRLLWGLAWAGIWVAGNAIVLDVAQEHNRGRWVGAYHFSFFLGAASGSIGGSLLTDILDFHRAMGVEAGLALLGAVVAFVVLPETSHLRELSDSPGSQRPAVLRRRRWAELSSATALYGVNRIVVAGILMATFSLYMAQRVGTSMAIAGLLVPVTTLTGLLLGTSTLIGMIASPIAGTLSDRLRSRWSVVSGGLVAGITGFILLSLGAPLAIFFGLPLTSISSGSNQGLSTALIGDLSGRTRQGRRLGILFTVGDLGSAIGPPIAYRLFPVIGLDTVYLLGASLLGLMLLVATGWTVRSTRFSERPSSIGP